MTPLGVPVFLGVVIVALLFYIFRLRMKLKVKETATVYDQNGCPFLNDARRLQRWHNGCHATALSVLEWMEEQVEAGKMEKEVAEDFEMRFVLPIFMVLEQVNEELARIESLYENN